MTGLWMRLPGPVYALDTDCLITRNPDVCNAGYRVSSVFRVMIAWSRTKYAQQVSWIPPLVTGPHRKAYYSAPTRRKGILHQRRGGKRGIHQGPREIGPTNAKVTMLRGAVGWWGAPQRSPELSARPADSLGNRCGMGGELNALEVVYKYIALGFTLLSAVLASVTHWEPETLPSGPKVSEASRRDNAGAFGGDAVGGLVLREGGMALRG